MHDTREVIVGGGDDHMSADATRVVNELTSEFADRTRAIGIEEHIDDATDGAIVVHQQKPSSKVQFLTRGTRQSYLANAYRVLFDNAKLTTDFKFIRNVILPSNIEERHLQKAVKKFWRLQYSAFLKTAELLDVPLRDKIITFGPYIPPNDPENVLDSLVLNYLSFVRGRIKQAIEDGKLFRDMLKKINKGEKIDKANIDKVKRAYISKILIPTKKDLDKASILMYENVIWIQPFNDENKRFARQVFEFAQLISSSVLYYIEQAYMVDRGVLDNPIPFDNVKKIVKPMPIINKDSIFTTTKEGIVIDKSLYERIKKLRLYFEKVGFTSAFLDNFLKERSYLFNNFSSLILPSGEVKLTPLTQEAKRDIIDKGKRVSLENQALTLLSTFTRLYKEVMLTQISHAQKFPVDKVHSLLIYKIREKIEQEDRAYPNYPILLKLVQSLEKHLKDPKRYLNDLRNIILGSCLAEGETLNVAPYDLYASVNRLITLENFGYIFKEIGNDGVLDIAHRLYFDNDFRVDIESLKHRYTQVTDALFDLPENEVLHMIDVDKMGKGDNGLLNILMRLGDFEGVFCFNDLNPNIQEELRAELLMFIDKCSVVFTNSVNDPFRHDKHYQHISSSPQSTVRKELEPLLKELLLMSSYTDLGHSAYTKEGIEEIYNKLKILLKGENSNDIYTLLLLLWKGKSDYLLPSNFTEGALNKYLEALYKVIASHFWLEKDDCIDRKLVIFSNIYLDLGSQKISAHEISKSSMSEQKYAELRGLLERLFPVDHLEIKKMPLSEVQQNIAKVMSLVNKYREKKDKHTQPIARRIFNQRIEDLNNSFEL